MKRLVEVCCLIIAGATLAWLSAEPMAFTATQFIPVRNLLVQYSGLLAMVVMSFSVMLAARPRWPEVWLGGLDKMYRLHKWLGVSALGFITVHWVSANAPGWAVALGQMERGRRPPRPEHSNPVERFFSGYHGAAEFLGEWTFYVVALLLILALVKWVPYRLFHKTHRLLAPAYLVLVFHAVILTRFTYWLSPVGLILAPLLLGGTAAAVTSLVGLIAARKQTSGTITATHYYPGVRTLEVSVSVPMGWRGHRAGQFAFVTSDGSEGAHPYTIASAWDGNAPAITFIVKALGDHTRTLHEKLKVGRNVTIEGPYGCFTFDDACPDQIWVGGGIGITPFVARMKQLAAGASKGPQSIHLFHPTADHDDEALAKLAADASAAGVTVQVLIDAQDGRLSGERIRQQVPNWRQASIWYCGPIGLGRALRRDFAAAGLPLGTRFHQELFSMR